MENYKDKEFKMIIADCKAPWLRLHENQPEILKVNYVATTHTKTTQTHNTMLLENISTI